MTLVVELRDLKQDRHRPSSCCWQRRLNSLCVQRLRIACLGLLAVAVGYPVDSGTLTRAGGLASLCDVLTAAVSASFALLCDACDVLSASLIEPPSLVFGLSEQLSGCFGESLLPFDTCPAAGPLPTFSGLRLFALGACALLLFGCSFGRREPTGRDEHS